MIRGGDKYHERGAEKCVSEHWVAPRLNLSPSKVSPQGWGGRMGGGQGWGEEELQRDKEKDAGGGGQGEQQSGEVIRY